MPQTSTSTARLLSIVAAVACISLAVLYVFSGNWIRVDRSLDAVADTPAHSAADATRTQNESASKGVSQVAAMPRTPTAKRRAASIAANVEAPKATWPTEAFSETATKKLKQLSKGLAKDGSEYHEIGSFVSGDFRCGALRPAPFAVNNTGDYRISHWRAGDDQQPLVHDSFSIALQELFLEGKPTRIAFKIVRVADTVDGFRTQLHVEGGQIPAAAEQGRGTARRRVMQWTANWNCEWTKNAILQSIRVEDYEEVAANSEASLWLTDAAPAVLANEESYRRQLLFGMDYWVNRIEHRFYPNRLGHHGLAVGDVNGDGLEDLYVCQPGGLPNRLYLHQPDGSAIDDSHLAGVDVLDDTTAALLVDLDNDGDQDLALLTISGGYIFSNDGRGRFALQVTLADCRNAFSLTAADYNQDGQLDLYVGRYWPDESVRGAIPLPVPYYDAINGGRNLLLRNDGDWDFADVTKQVGLDQDNTRYTMAAAWEDFDNDGDQDLYVANDFGRNCLYRNDRGRFENVAAELGVEDTAAGMSVSWADFDHDGRQDLYVGNMFSSAGGRITNQSQYAERFDPVAQQKLQRLARGNSLFRNAAEGFEDISQAAKVTMGRWAWGSIFVDLNNDSWDDLVVANGHVTTEDSGDL